MKIALVHDYLNEFGGAERVFKVLSEMYPKAPIYTAFYKKGSTAYKEFKDKDIRESWLAPIIKIDKLYSPLRFLTPLIWKSMDFSEYDLVLTSASWYITRGFKVSKSTKVVCYCHTPPRWLYGYETSVGFKKWWSVRLYAAVVGHFIRLFDFKSAQAPSNNVLSGRGVDKFIANSENVKRRIEKFYRRDSKVIYPPIEVKKIKKQTSGIKNKEDYFLIVSRLVGAKGLEEAVKVFNGLKYKLKIVGEKHGFSDIEEKLKKLAGGNVELLGRVNDKKLWELYAKAKGFIALARDEDFGMTVVEAQAAGTPVIAFNGGGFRESVIDDKTGILIDDTNKDTIKKAVEKMVKKKWNKKVLKENAERFSKERFVREMKKVVRNIK
jgi:glycosyltransferase involved in cell wall biosynthesis